VSERVVTGCSGAPGAMRVSEQAAVTPSPRVVFTRLLQRA